PVEDTENIQEEETIKEAETEEQVSEEAVPQKAEDDDKSDAAELKTDEPDLQEAVETDEEEETEEQPENSSEQEEAAAFEFEHILDEDSSTRDNDRENIDLFELGGYDKKTVKKNKDKNRKKWHKTVKGKIFISVIVLLFAAIAGTGAYGFWFVNHALDTITDNNPDRNQDNSTIDSWTGMDEFSESFITINEDSRANVSSYRDMVKKWYYNGEPARSSNVINVLLIGEDTRGEDISDKGTRADSAIIASLNTSTSEIVLTSILRDSYIYYETTIGDESTGRWDKINSAMSYGGVNCYINAVERNFKVNIDNYVIVNFSSFQKIIDTLGGVRITMTNAEIREINNHPGTYGNVSINGQAGELLLDGEQALAYCRIRHIDSDNVRADRQKTVLLQLFKQLKDASAFKLAEVVTNLLPYVKTGYSKSEIISIGQYALSHGWISYKTVTYTVPTNETDTDGTAITTCKGGTYYGAWVWKVDCPLASQILQKKIYGKTSIVLSENRPNFSALSDY
ncbi:MAG: LCP family protein, partial [Eubacterium sp.]